jgi:hypothetical protein
VRSAIASIISSPTPRFPLRISVTVGPSTLSARASAAFEPCWSRSARRISRNRASLFPNFYVLCVVFSDWNFCECRLRHLESDGGPLSVEWGKRRLSNFQILCEFLHLSDDLLTFSFIFDGRNSLAHSITLGLHLLYVGHGGATLLIKLEECANVDFDVLHFARMLECFGILAEEV